MRLCDQSESFNEEHEQTSRKCKPQNHASVYTDRTSLPCWLCLCILLDPCFLIGVETFERVHLVYHVTGFNKYSAIANVRCFWFLFNR